MFPDPQDSSVIIDGIHCLQLRKLIELKIASGMTNPGRVSDLGDAQRLISVLDLPAELSSQMNPFVRDKYLELWNGVHQTPSNPA